VVAALDARGGRHPRTGAWQPTKRARGEHHRYHRARAQRRYRIPVAVVM